MIINKYNRITNRYRNKYNTNILIRAKYNNE